MRSHHPRSLLIGAGAFALLALAPARPLVAQSLEGSKWSIEQEGMDTAVTWWFGSEGRVRTGDLGMILPAYKWRQNGDSVFVTVGDTVRYVAMLMSNRLVGGIRSGRNRQEGWWSGTRADVAAPTTVAAAPAPTPTPPAAEPAGVQPMSRPADSATTTPSSPAVVPPPGGRRPLRQIIRGDGGNAPAGQAAPAGEGRQMRRIERAQSEPNPAPVTSTPAGAVDASMVGSWVRADSVGMIDGFDLTGDGKAVVHLRNGVNGAGEWVSDNEGSRITVRGAEGGEVHLVVWSGGPGLRGTVITAAGPRRTLAFRRAPQGPAREPAIRQP